MGYDRRKVGDVLFFALECAVQDRLSIIDAWGGDDDEEAVKDAKRDIKSFNRLKHKLFPTRISSYEAIFLEPAQVLTFTEIKALLNEEL